MGIMQKHEWEFRLKDGNCRVQAVRDNIIRCSYTKRENWEQKSPVGIKVCPESSFSVSEDGEKTVFRISAPAPYLPQMPAVHPPFQIQSSRRRFAHDDRKSSSFRLHGHYHPTQAVKHDEPFFHCR